MLVTADLFFSNRTDALAFFLADSQKGMQSRQKHLLLLFLSISRSASSRIMKSRIALLTTLACVDAFQVSFTRPATRGQRHSTPLVAILEEPPKDDWFQRFVLLRPQGCDECTVDNECAVEPHELGPTCETERVPGTLRTFIFSSIFCCLVAIPLLLANPAVLPKLLEVCSRLPSSAHLRLCRGN